MASKQRTAHPGAILLIEDETPDATLVRRAFEKTGVRNPIIHLRNGETAMAYILGVEPYSNRVLHPLPVLILLDLKMPRMGGLEFLQWRRTQKDVRKTPVVVLTADNDSQSINAAYQLGANSYLIKPSTPDDVRGVVDALYHYWLQLNEPPKLVIGASNGPETP